MLNIADAAYLRVASKSVDLQYLKARNSDYDAFGRDKYLRIIETTNELVNEQLLRSSDDILATVSDAHDKIQTVMAEGGLQHSEVLQWSLKTLEHLKRSLPKKKRKKLKPKPESEPEPKPKAATPKKREKTNAERTSRSKELNKEIFNCYGGRKCLPATLNSIISLVKKHRAEMNVVNAATISYELGKACDEYSDENKEGIYELLGLVTDIVRETNRKGIGNKSLSTLLYGLQHFDESTVPEELLDEIKKKMESSRGKYDEQAVYMGMIGLIGLQELPVSKWIIRRLIDHLECNRRKKMTRQSLVSLMQAFSLLRIHPPIWLQTRYVLSLEKEQKPSEVEKKAYNIMCELHPDKIIAHNFFVDGFELDLFFPLERTNVELDDARHSRKRSKDKRRDDYLLEARGIKVERRRSVKNKKELRKRLESIKIG